MRTFLTSLALVATLSVAAQTVEQTFYIDYGAAISTNGEKTLGADVNGHYWTNVTSTTSHNHIYPQAVQMVNSQNQTTDYRVEIGSFFNTNGKQNGALLSPKKELLGDLAIATATHDYMFVETWLDYNVVRFAGLDVTKAYRFYTFGSRTDTNARIGDFEFRGENVWTGTHQMSGQGIGDGGYNGNNKDILVSDPIFPDAQGVITMTMIKKNKSGMIHVNAMKVEELSGLERPNPELTLTQRFLVDFGQKGCATGNPTTGADVNGNYWNNVKGAGTGAPDKVTSGTNVTLYNTANTRSTYVLNVANANWQTNGVANGGLNDPKAQLLGDLAIQTATEDYAFVYDAEGKIVFKNLNKNNRYRFRMLGHRATNNDDRRSAVYRLEGQNVWQTVHYTSGGHVGGENVHGNNRNIAQSDYIIPDADGTITFTMRNCTEVKSDNHFAHINVMEITEYEGGTRPADPVILTTAQMTGSATEGGADVAMYQLNPSSTATGNFETYMKVRPGKFVITGKSKAGEGVTLGDGGAAGKVAVDGDSLVVGEEAVVRVRLNTRTGELTLVPVELYLKGNIVAGGTKVAYAGDGVWSQEVSMEYGDVFLFSDKYFYFAFNNDEGLAVKRRTGSRELMAMPSEGYATENIRINRGKYTLTLDMRNYKWAVDAPIDENKISAFGSSVCNGQGADGNKGYAYMLGEQLATRYKQKESDTPFYVSGVSIGGNTTTNLLSRYDEMTHDFGRYVIIGLSLGNEGIHGASDQSAIYTQFTTNMQKIISKVKADGKIPVVMNNYTRADYNDSDYSYVKKTNLTIHGWNVASVNVLGAIDKGNGQWADGYVADDYHQNTEGHREFMYAIPPSLFDALKAEKPQPKRDKTQLMALRCGSTLTFSGEGTVHPFTVCVRFKGTDAGRLLTVKNGTKDIYVDVMEGGKISYTGVDGTAHVSEKAYITSVSAQYNVSLTYYYAQKRTLVYVNNYQVLEVTGERIVPKLFTVGEPERDMARDYSELSFWRSGMTLDEMKDVQSGKMLKSSLEIYTPLSDDMKTAGFQNLAQSLNATLTYVQGDKPDAIGDVKSASESPTFYTVDGVRRSAPQKGINVVNGKKVLR
ncbi:MAG: SGNH/GDSL hydrolase family protein [Bacteroidaceae bacterium]|nr:SGNH/GDSL hydrolase family protein [Bacteroidaceae bacterium]